MICKKCGAKNEEGAEFCTRCGARTDAKQADLLNAPKQGNRAPMDSRTKKIVACTKMGTAFGLMLLFFILSFFGMIQFKVQLPIGENAVSTNIQITGIDLMAVPLNMIIASNYNDYSYEDFQNYVQKKAPNAFENGDAKEISRLITDYGVLKLVLRQSLNLETFRQTVTGIIYMSVIAWAIMLITLLFSIILFVRGIQQLMGRQLRHYGHQTMGFAVVFGLVLILPFFVNALPLFSIFDLRTAVYTGFGSSGIAMLVLSALALVGFTCSKYIFEGEKIQTKRLITRGVSLVGAIVIAACFTGSAVSITAKNPMDGERISTTVNINDIQMGVDHFSLRIPNIDYYFSYLFSENDYVTEETKLKF